MQILEYSNTDTFCYWDFAQKEGELWVYEYDLQNRLIKTSYSGKGKTNLKERASYTYDYRGLLVRKSYQDYDKSNYIELDKPTSSKEITEYYEYTLDGRVIYNERKDNSIVNKTDYIWANTTLWCEINEGVLYYHHTDHLGTTEVITDSNGNIVWHADYEAFGNVMNERGEENFTPNYTGKFFDKTTGLYYFNARWYDCELGRFTTQDPARDGMNWWAYCGGNPITFVDPDGKFILNTNIWYNKKYMQDFNASWPNSNESITKTGCTAVASLRGCNTIVNKYGFAMDTPAPISITEILDNKNTASADGMIFSGLKDLMASYGVDVTVSDTGREGVNNKTVKEALSEAVSSESGYIVIGRLKEKINGEQHYFNINDYNSKDNTVHGFDTSCISNGLGKQDRRNLKNASTEKIDRIILIKVNKGVNE